MSHYTKLGMVSSELLDGWSPEQEAELATLLHRVTGNLLSEKNTRELLSTPA